MRRLGAALVQHPEAYKAVVSYVGIYDMLRVELTTNGAFNVTEFGTVKDPALFKALYAYSPFHNVKDGTAYPAVMFLTVLAINWLGEATRRLFDIRAQSL